MKIWSGTLSGIIDKAESLLADLKAANVQEMVGVSELPSRWVPPPNGVFTEPARRRREPRQLHRAPF